MYFYATKSINLWAFFNKGIFDERLLFYLQFIPALFSNVFPGNRFDTLIEHVDILYREIEKERKKERDVNEPGYVDWISSTIEFHFVRCECRMGRNYYGHKARKKFNRA